MSKVTIVGFTYEISEVARHKEFLARTNQATADAFQYLVAHPQKMATSPIADIRRLFIPENETIKEYEDYSSVYFLNDIALMMCQDIALSLNIIGETDNLPHYYSYQLQAYYLPLAER